MSSESVAREFTAYARTKLTAHLAQIVRCAGLLSEAELWQRANEHCNSVGNLILHLTGNVRQWIVGGIGGEPFTRDRPAEFAQRGPLPAAEITGALEDVVRRACAVIEGLDAGALGVRRTIQGYDVSTLVAVLHVVEHFSFHTGQIVQLTKVMRNVGLSLYDAEGHRLPGDEPIP
jgi:uncharacterized damage-inducible protein DinB